MSSISVIIPCHNNHQALPWILQSINAARISTIEVICVDDASIEDIEAIAAEYGARYIRLPEGASGRRAMARNHGHQTSRGDITFYLDGDIIPEPRLFVKAIQLHRETSGIAIKYPVYSILEDIHTKSLSLLSALIISHDLKNLGSSIRKHFGIDTRPLPRRLRGEKTNIWVLCASHCMSVEWREVEKIGGWDEAFLGWGEEDIEFAYRLHKNNIMFVFPHRKNGAAYHLDHPVHWQNNIISLNRNLQYFREKFPESWSGRRGILRMYLEENDLPPLQSMAEDASSITKHTVPIGE